MRNFALVFSLLVIAAAAPVHAGDGKNKDNKHVTAAPEIDPASAISALTLLAGGLAVIRGRRRKP